MALNILYSKCCVCPTSKHLELDIIGCFRETDPKGIGVISGTCGELCNKDESVRLQTLVNLKSTYN